MENHHEGDRRKRKVSSNQADDEHGNVNGYHDRGQSSQPNNNSNGNDYFLDLSLDFPPRATLNHHHQPPSDPSPPLGGAGLVLLLPHHLMMMQSPTISQQQHHPPSNITLSTPQGQGGADPVVLLPHHHLMMQSPTTVLLQQQHHPPSNNITLSTLTPQSAAASSSRSIAISNPKDDDASINIAPNYQHAYGSRNSAGTSRKLPTRGVPEGKSEHIDPPYPWATNRRAKIHSREYLVDSGITTITGEVQCKKCEKKYEIKYDLETKSREVKEYAVSRRSSMHDRAPEEWMHPKLLRCEFCGEERSVKPVSSERKRDINWLFLLLGQMLGICTLEQLKYFCKHTNIHRTGAKNRIVYYAYFELLKQLLDPDGPGYV